MDPVVRAAKSFVEGFVAEWFERIDTAKTEWEKATDKVPPPEPRRPRESAETQRRWKLFPDDYDAPPTEDPDAGPAPDQKVSVTGVHSALIKQIDATASEGFAKMLQENAPNTVALLTAPAEQTAVDPGRGSLIALCQDATTPDQIEALFKATVGVQRGTLERKKLGVAILRQIDTLLHEDVDLTDDDKARLVITKVDVGIQIFGLTSLGPNRTSGPPTPTTDF